MMKIKMADETRCYNCLMVHPFEADEGDHCDNCGKELK